MNVNAKRKQLAVQVKVLDGAKGLVEYIASDESIDSYGEVIRANGWRFDRFAKNAPFVDSHRYDSLECLLGKVVDFRVVGSSLIETVQWAIDVPENRRAQVGWAMTAAGYCKAVSVGFYPVRMVSRWDPDKTAWLAQLKELGLHEEDGVRSIYVEQQQVELSAVIVPANPNSVALTARAFRAGVITERDLEFLAGEIATPATRNASAAQTPGPADDEAKARTRSRQAFLEGIQRACQAI